MRGKLHKNTASPLLLEILQKIMESAEFGVFRLVGGTGLSLQRGHRISVDIDLFTDSPYGTIDFGNLEYYLQQHWHYSDTLKNVPAGMGKSCFVGLSADNCIKLDLYYTDTFIEDFRLQEGIRLATINEILAMKMDVIYRGGRKKDFWDIHELMEEYALEEMLELHKKRYPYTHNQDELIRKMNDFSLADDDFDPVCLRGKHWELIKLDIIEMVEQYHAGG